MLRVLHGDMVAAARTLLAVPAPQRDALLRRMLVGADLAERHRRRSGRTHPRYGTGSLMASAGGWPQRPEPFLDDPDYLDCLARVIAALRVRARRKRSTRTEAARVREADGLG